MKDAPGWGVLLVVEHWSCPTLVQRATDALCLSSESGDKVASAGQGPPDPLYESGGAGEVVINRVFMLVNAALWEDQAKDRVNTRLEHVDNAPTSYPSQVWGVVTELLACFLPDGYKVDSHEDLLFR